jgi:hypothetical protein
MHDVGQYLEDERSHNLINVICDASGFALACTADSWVPYWNCIIRLCQGLGGLLIAQMRHRIYPAFKLSIA